MMEYEEMELIKQNEKGIVQLIKEKDGEHFFIRKVIKGHNAVYFALQGCRHPCLPKIYEAAVTDNITTIIEEYIEGQSLGSAKLSEKQFRGVVRDLCSVLEFLHGMGIIHRDIKPSNIIYAKDEHIRLIDFDAARVLKEDQEQEQDTRLLGTRGYAPPEQYGFSQTDVRTDIYSLGVTLEQILQNKFQRIRYKRIIRKCMELDPDKRYQSIRQVKSAFFHTKQSFLCGFAALILLVFLCGYFIGYLQNSSVMEPELTASERYPNQILWNGLPVRDYLGRYIDDIMDEIEEPYDEYLEGEEENICAYREIGIIFWFDDKRRVDLIAVDPVLGTFNGESLNGNEEKLLALLGYPTFSGWEENEEVYYMDYYDIDTKEGITFYMKSPEEEAHVIYLD